LDRYTDFVYHNRRMQPQRADATVSNHD
jgi:hypothetical protein